MSNVELSDMLRYCKYKRETGLVIFLNDRFNYQLREKHIKNYTIVRQDDGQYLLDVMLDLSLDYEELLYRGNLKTTYSKILASKVFKNSFILPNDLPSHLLTKDLLLDKFNNHLGLAIEADEIEIVREGDKTTLYFTDSSLFWTGSVVIRSQTDPTPY